MVCSGGVDNVVINEITELACLKQKCSCCRCASNQNVGVYSILEHIQCSDMGAQWLRGRVIASRPRGHGFEPHWCHCVVSLSKNINPSLVLVQPRKTRPFITEILLMGLKGSNPTKTKQCSDDYAPVCSFIYTIYSGKGMFNLNFRTHSMLVPTNMLCFQSLISWPMLCYFFVIW